MKLRYFEASSEEDTSKLFTNIKIRKAVPYVSILGISVYGLIIIIMLLPLNLTSYHYEVILYIASHIQNTTRQSDSDDDRTSNYPNGKTIFGSNYWL